MFILWSKMVKEVKNNNPFKGCITKDVKYRNEKEFLDLTNAIETNDQQKVLDIIFKIYHEKRLRWN